MKFKVWWLEDNFQINEIISNDQYEINVNIIQTVIDSWRNRGINIAYGYYDDLYQFHFVDWDVKNKFVYNKYLANKFLFDIEKAMSKFKIK